MLTVAWVRPYLGGGKAAGMGLCLIRQLKVIETNDGLNLTLRAGLPLLRSPALIFPQVVQLSNGELSTVRREMGTEFKKG